MIDHLTLTPWQFDQEELEGSWRYADDGGNPQLAFELILSYLAAYADGDNWKPETPEGGMSSQVRPWLLHWHAGQVAAFQSRYDIAIEQMTSCICLGPEPSFLAYARGTVCFLRGDREGLRAEIPNTHGKNRVLLQKFLAGMDTGKTYAQAY